MTQHTDQWPNTMPPQPAMLIHTASIFTQPLAEGLESLEDISGSNNELNAFSVQSPQFSPADLPLLNITPALALLEKRLLLIYFPNNYNITIQTDKYFLTMLWKLDLESHSETPAPSFDWVWVSKQVLIVS